MKPYQRGDVVIIDVPIPASGHVQGGKRPWVIVQNNMGNQFSATSIVIPLTTKMKRLEMPTHVAFVWEKLEPSMAECEQVRVIDITDDWKYVCSNKQTRIEFASDNIKKNFYFKHPTTYKRGSQYWNFMKELTTYTRSGKVPHDDAPDSLALLENEIRMLSGGKIEIFKRPC